MEYRGNGYLIAASGKYVTAYARRRLAFEINKAPAAIRAEMAAFKRDLVASLRGLTASEEDMLYAAYGTSRPGGIGADAENILFYNVGAGVFRPITANGLQFTVRPAEDILLAQARERIPEDYCHCYTYRLAAPEQEAGGRPVLASWEPIPIFPVRNCSAFQYWSWIKQSAAQIDAAGAQTDGAFSVHLRLYVPQGVQINPSSVVKPMLDGIISAFHSAASTMDIPLLSRQLNCPPEWLENRELAPLGPYRYVFPYRTASLQWSPGDDRCLECSLRLIRGADQWRLGGRLEVL